MKIDSDIKEAFKRYLKEKKLTENLVINQCLRRELSEEGFL